MPAANGPRIPPQRRETALRKFEAHGRVQWLARAFDGAWTPHRRDLKRQKPRCRNPVLTFYCETGPHCNRRRPLPLKPRGRVTRPHGRVNRFHFGDGKSCLGRLRRRTIVCASTQSSRAFCRRTVPGGPMRAVWRRGGQGRGPARKTLPLHMRSVLLTAIASEVMSQWAGLSGA